MWVLTSIAVVRILGCGRIVHHECLWHHGLHCHSSTARGVVDFVCAKCAGLTTDTVDLDIVRGERLDYPRNDTQEGLTTTAG